MTNTQLVSTTNDALDVSALGGCAEIGTDREHLAVAGANPASANRRNPVSTLLRFMTNKKVENKKTGKILSFPQKTPEMAAAA